MPAEPRIERGAQLRDQVGQRIGEIFVFAAAEAVAPHHDAAAEMLVVRIERRQRGAFVRRQQSLQDGAALRVEIGGRLRPVDGIDAGGDADGICLDSREVGLGHVGLRNSLFRDGSKRRARNDRLFRNSGPHPPPDFRKICYWNWLIGTIAGNMRPSTAPRVPCARRS